MLKTDKTQLQQLLNIKEFNKFINKKLKQPDHYSQVKFDQLVLPITLLLGPNGSGKTMSLTLLKEHFKKHKLQYLTYSTTHDDIVRTSIRFEPYAMSCAFHSEGERMCDSFYHWANSSLLKAILTNKDPLYVIVDEADSGLSLDTLRKTAQDIIFLATEELKKQRKIHFIVTCNSYEFYEQFKETPLAHAIWTPTKEVIYFKDYNQFALPYLYFYEKMQPKDTE